jgi:serine/threonine protein phosphatase PrpC
VSQLAAFGCAASIGQRKVQEDSLAWTNDLVEEALGRPRLVVVCDGMGGHAAGDVASRLAAESFLVAYRRDTSGSPAVLGEALDWANGRLADHIARNPSTEGMGCTMVAVELSADGSAFRWLSVGDSLLLSVRGDHVERLNEDHSFREELRRLEAAGHDVSGGPSANMLRSAVMGGHIPLVDDKPWRGFAQDEILVLATDGLDTLELQDIHALVAQSQNAEMAANALVDAVERAGRPRQDNTTVAVLWNGQGVGGARGRAGAVWGGPQTVSSGRAAPRKSNWWVLGLTLALGVALGAAACWVALVGWPGAGTTSTEQSGQTAKAKVKDGLLPADTVPSAKPLKDGRDGEDRKEPKAIETASLAKKSPVSPAKPEAAAKPDQGAKPHVAPQAVPASESGVTAGGGRAASVPQLRPVPPPQ